MAQLTELDIEGLLDPVLLIDCPELAESVAAVAVGWTITRTDNDGPEPSLSGPWPLVRVQPGPTGYTILSPLRQLIGQTRVEAISAILWHLVKTLYLSRPEMIPIHCGSFALNGHLIGYAGASGMGKSTLTARLCVESDVLVFGDDILLARPDGRAEGVGVLPRLRPPLPPSASPRFVEFIARHAGPSDSAYHYVASPRVAPLGTEARLSGLLFLDRRPRVTAPYFAPLAPERRFMDWVEATIASNAPTMAAHLDRLNALASTVPVYRLVYSDLEAVVDLLREATATADRFEPALRHGDDEPEATQRWIRAPGVSDRTVGGVSVVLRDAGFEVIEVNAMAQALLAMIDAGLERDEMLALMAETYPAVAEAALGADIDRALLSFAARGIILPLA